MKRSLINYTVDVGMLISFVAVLFTGIVKFPMLLRMLAKRGVYLPSSEITIVHEWGGVMMALFIMLHLILHWKWLASSTKRFFTKKSGVHNSKITEQGP
jgi:hypothetical protein